MGKSLGLELLLFRIVLIVAIEQEKEFNLNFQQHDYKLTFERLELVRYGKDYVRDMSIVTFKYNRTQAVANWTFTFNTDFGNDLTCLVQAYKFMSNEYRLFPMRFAISFCKALAADTAGTRRMLSCGNFRGCPMLQGKTYHVCNFSPDETKLPPLIPNGNYKVEVQASYFSKEVFTFNAYASITRPLQWRN